jgi:DNA-binding XRE family transcriptional regulator
VHLIKPNSNAQRTHLFGQVSGYRLDLTQALITTETGKLLPQLTIAINVRKTSRHRANITMVSFFHSLWINTMNRCFYPHGEAQP